MPGGPLAGQSPSASSDSLPHVLWRSRWIILVCVVAAVTAGVIYVQTATPIYTSTSRLWLDYGGIRVTTYEESGRPRTDKYLHTQAQLVRSRPILGVAYEALRTQRLRTFGDVKLPIDYLRRSILVDVGKRDEIIRVSFSSPYPVEAAEIVNRVVEAYMASRSENEQADSAKVMAMLQNEKKRRDAELAEKSDALETFRTQKMPLSRGGDQSGAVMQRDLELQNELTRAESEAEKARLFYESVKALAQSPTALREYLLAKNYVSWSVRASQDRDSLEDRLSALDGQLVEAVLAAAGQQYQDAKEYEEELTQRCEEQQTQVRLYQTEIARYQRLQSEVSQLEAWSRMLEQEVREVRKIMGEDVGQLRMAVMEPALRAQAPSEPQKSKVVALALVFGLMLGGGIAVARDLLDQTLRSTDEISAALGVPILGIVPAMPRRQKMQLRGRQVSLRPNSREAEAFRTVRTAIVFGAWKDSARTILITSPASGDGKSTLVSNLAIAMADAGQKTLILDADFRKPTQQAIFELDRHERCLNNVFAGKTKLGEAIQSTEVRGLSLLTCGFGIANPAEVLSSRTFATVLERLATAYDRVLIDAPPVTVVTDAQILGAICNYTVLVLKADKSTRRIARRAIDSLQSVGTRLLGVVVNDARATGDRYGYYADGRGYYSPSLGNGGDGRKGRRVDEPRRGVTV
jgi:capsular exopolysaccharide synthesis family protein